MYGRKDICFLPLSATARQDNEVLISFCKKKKQKKKTKKKNAKEFGALALALFITFRFKNCILRQTLLLMEFLLHFASAITVCDVTFDLKKRKEPFGLPYRLT